MCVQSISRLCEKQYLHFGVGEGGTPQNSIISSLNRFQFLACAARIVLNVCEHADEGGVKYISSI